MRKKNSSRRTRIYKSGNKRRSSRTPTKNNRVVKEVGYGSSSITNFNANPISRLHQPSRMQGVQRAKNQGKQRIPMNTSGAYNKRSIQQFNKRMDMCNNELALFYEELSCAPISNEENFVFKWSPNLKKYACEQDYLLLRNYSINKYKFNDFMTQLEKLPKFNPETRYKAVTTTLMLLTLTLSITFLLLGIFLLNRTQKIIFFSLMSGFFLLFILFALLTVRSKSVRNKHFKLRRQKIRTFLKTKNFELFDNDGQHWSPSPRLSYLIFRMNYEGKPGWNSVRTMEMNPQDVINEGHSKPGKYKFKKIANSPLKGKHGFLGSNEVNMEILDGSESYDQVLPMENDFSNSYNQYGIENSCDSFQIVGYPGESDFYGQSVMASKVQSANDENLIGYSNRKKRRSLFTITEKASLESGSMQKGSELYKSNQDSKVDFTSRYTNNDNSGAKSSRKVKHRPQINSNRSHKPDKKGRKRERMAPFVIRDKSNKENISQNNLNFKKKMNLMVSSNSDKNLFKFKKEKTQSRIRSRRRKTRNINTAL